MKTSIPSKSSSSAATTTAASSAKRTVLDVLIIGGGLSGVMLAHQIQNQIAASRTSTAGSSSLPSPSWKLLEARSVLGGRLVNDNMGNQIDLGGAWIWPHHQPYVKRLVKDLPSIKTFPQPDDPSSTRIDGGAVELIHQLSKDLPSDNIVLQTPVKKLRWIDNNHDDDDDDEVCQEPKNDNKRNKIIEIQTVDGSKRDDDDSNDDNDGTYFAKRVVIAVPPRLISEYIQFDPPLSDAKRHAMATSDTWMAGVTKVALVYPTKFWDESVSNMGLPSHMGPAFQVYDSSTEDGSVSALTFFTLVPYNSPAATDDKILGDMVAKQMGNVWNYFRKSQLVDKVSTYSTVHVQRWPNEKYISENNRPKRINPHPSPIRALSTNEWDNQLLFAGSESDTKSPGVMEGAIGSAMRVWQSLQSFFDG